MIENFTYKGIWFLPSSKEERINGILTFNASEGCSLELFGSFDSLYNYPEIIDTQIIQGVTSDSKQITLYKCFVTDIGGLKLVSGQETGNPTTIYTVNFVFENVHIDTLNDFKFQKMFCEIQNLDEWVGCSGFKNPIMNRATKEIEIYYQLPKPIEFNINENFDGEFTFKIDTPKSSSFLKHINLKQVVELGIISKVEFAFETFLKYLYGFQNFLILGLYDKTYPNNITLYNDRFLKDYGDDKPMKREIKLYFPISKRNNSVKLKSAFDMLFCYPQIKEEFDIIIKKWFEKYDLLESAFNLLFEHFYNSERFTENTFLNLAQSAETFHSRTNNHTRMPVEVFNTMKAEILSVVPSEYHVWLKEQFNFGNNLNLHTRLTEIVSTCSNEILDKILGDKELFIKQVKWSRNYYTHYSSNGKKQALKGTDLFYLTEKLKIVLVCAFLIEVGFDKDKLKTLLEQKKYRYFGYIK